MKVFVNTESFFLRKTTLQNKKVTSFSANNNNKNEIAKKFN
jgi:hypothetical protein